MPKWRLLAALYDSLWCPWGPGAVWDADLDDGCVPMESRLEPEGSGLKDFTLPAGSSFFFCSFWKCYRVGYEVKFVLVPRVLTNQRVNNLRKEQRTSSSCSRFFCAILYSLWSFRAPNSVNFDTKIQRFLQNKSTKQSLAELQRVASWFTSQRSYVTSSPPPYLDMFWVAVGFKALCDSVSNLQQACACVLELLLVGQALIWFIQLLQGFFHRPHALLTLDTHTHKQIHSNALTNAWEIRKKDRNQEKLTILNVSWSSSSSSFPSMGTGSDPAVMWTGPWVFFPLAPLAWKVKPADIKTKHGSSTWFTERGYKGTRLWLMNYFLLAACWILML